MQGKGLTNKYLTQHLDKVINILKKIDEHPKIASSKRPHLNESFTKVVRPNILALL